MYEGVVQDLIDELGRLPGVGPKGAQRIARHPEATGYAVGLLAWALSGGVLVAGKGITGEMGPITFP